MATAARDGMVRYEYSENGREAHWDTDARQWLAALLPEVFRSTGINAEERVERIFRAAGFDSPEEQARRGTLLQLVHKFLEGPESVVLNAPTTAESDGAFVVYDLYGLKAFKQRRVQAAVAWAVAEHVRRIAFDDHPELQGERLLNQSDSNPYDLPLYYRLGPPDDNLRQIPLHR